MCLKWVKSTLHIAPLLVHRDTLNPGTSLHRLSLVQILGSAVSGFDYTLLPIQGIISSFNMPAPVKSAFEEQDRNGNQNTERKSSEYWRHCCECDAVGRVVYFGYVTLPVIATQSVQHTTEPHSPQAGTETTPYDSRIFLWYQSRHIYKTDVLSKIFLFK